MDKKGERNYFSVRLKMARKMAGLSMDELVDRIDGLVSKQALSKYERGLMNPSSTVLIALSNALNVKPDHFYRRSDLNLYGLQFRKKSELNKKEIERIKFKAVEYLERYNELENILGINNKFSVSLKIKEINSVEDAENAALELRQKWGLGISPIPNLLELMEEKNIKIVKIASDKKFDGLKAELNGNPVIVLNENKPVDRIRFTAAHELSHILFKFDKKGKKEELCHLFAGAFLLPSEMLKRELLGKRTRITFWELKEMKSVYGVSFQVILKRALALNIISESSYSTMHGEMKRNNWLNEEPVSYSINDDSNRFLQLLIYSVSEGLISESKAASLLNSTILEFRRISAVT